MGERRGIEFETGFRLRAPNEGGSQKVAELADWSGGYYRPGRENEVTEVATTEIAMTFKIWQTGNSYIRK